MTSTFSGTNEIAANSEQIFEETMVALKQGVVTVSEMMEVAEAFGIDQSVLQNSSVDEGDLRAA